MDNNNNSGDYNSGNYNSGDCNSGYYNSGSFNTNCPKMRLFNKDLDMTVEEFYSKYNICMDIPLSCWINKKNMTEEEKNSVKGWETMGGYLKTLPYKEACQKWWEENPNDHERFLTLPGFDAEIFKEITGIDVAKPEVMITLSNGKKVSESTIIEALKGLVRDR